MDDKVAVMVPVKFQIDMTGENILASSEDKATVAVFVNDPSIVAEIACALGLKPQTKIYAMAGLNEAGAMVIGDTLEDQQF